MKQLIFKTNNNWAPSLMRLMLGAVLFPHGAQKLLGWFGGYGFTGTMQFFTGTVHLPWIVGFAVILIEFFGSLLLIAGLGTRIVGLLVTGLMAGIVLTSHIQNGFFMNWYGTQKGEGVEYFLLAMGLSLSLVLTGAGSLSLDRLTWRSEAPRRQPQAAVQF